MCLSQTKNPLSMSKYKAFFLEKLYMPTILKPVCSDCFVLRHVPSRPGANLHVCTMLKQGRLHGCSYLNFNESL